MRRRYDAFMSRLYGALLQFALGFSCLRIPEDNITLALRFRALLTEGDAKHLALEWT
jgi:hypothetical protein